MKGRVFLAAVLTAIFLPATAADKVTIRFVGTFSGSSAIAPMQGTMFSTADQKLLWRSPMPVVNPGNGVAIDGDGKEPLYRAIDAALKGSSDQVQGHFFHGF